jgi:hypothetical protein
VALEAVARGTRDGILDDLAAVDRLLDGGGDQPPAELGDAMVPEGERLVEVVTGVDMDDWERIGCSQQALVARWRSTSESLPPENSSASRSHSATISWITWNASDSRVSKWVT